MKSLKRPMFKRGGGVSAKNNGIVQGFEEELGYFSEDELKSLSPKVWQIKKIDLPYAGRRE